MQTSKFSMDPPPKKKIFLFLCVFWYFFVGPLQSRWDEIHQSGPRSHPEYQDTLPHPIPFETFNSDLILRYFLHV